MSFIEFESGWEKEKARQELRDVRAELLKRAEENAKRRDEKELQKKFRGDDQWMLPSVSKRIDEQSGETSSSKKKEKKSKKSKKVKKSSKKHKKEKKKSKKHKYSSSSNESDDSSEEEERVSKRKRKRKHFSDVSSSSSSDSESEEDSWVEKGKIDDKNKNDAEPKKTNEIPLQREDWLSGFSGFTKSKEPKERKKEERKGIDSYEPGKSVRELNPYWKDGGDGLPKAFAKPNYDSDDEKQHTKRSYQSKQSDYRERQSNWKKKTESQSQPSYSTSTAHASRREAQRRSSSSSSSSSVNRSPSPALKSNEPSNVQASRNDFLTDQQMNELGAKLVKAEIMGNDELAQELKEKLDKARKFRTEHKSEVLAKSFDRRAAGAKSKKEKEDAVVLSTTNSTGLSRPVTKPQDDSDLWGGRAGRKAKKQKPVETHAGGERVRYFADDDRYDIKQMFESEKFTSAADQDMQFANIAGKHKNPNDDLEDIFADKVRKNISENDMDKKERDRAIREHQEMERTLDTCDKCFDSSKLEKQLIVSLGKNVYLSLPWHEGLTTGHCLIAPLAHVSCSTQLEDDVWREIRELMTALNRMFNSRKQDVIFFETVRFLHRRPHMVIHCVPSSEFEVAPFYFKKAIQESEAEWATNKQLVSLKERDVRRSIPKGLPYFWVNFGMDSGFAHVIEDQNQFPSNFAQEIIGGMLNLDARLWRRPRKINNPIPKVKQFADWWKLFDSTR